MADQTPTQKPAQPAPSGTAPSGTSRHRTGSGATRPQSGRHPAARMGRHRHMSTRDINQMLSEMGSYTKYSKVVNDCNFDVKLRCQCNRSRNMSWMFLCTVCATGTKVEKTEDDSATTKYSSILHATDSPLQESETKDNNENTNKDDKLKDDKKQRPFLSCDLCAHKITETYYCPNCLNAYPAQYVKQQTRCPRCVACPICVSPLEKIVYAGGSTEAKNNNENNTSNQPKDSLVAPGGDNKIKPSEPQKIGDGNNDKKGKAKDVYLYQCPFCFWSSNLIGLEAPTSDVLLQNLNNKIKEPYDKKLKLMDEIEGKYNDMNESLRKEEERLHNARHYHKNYKTKSVLFDNLPGNTGNNGKSGKKKNKRKGSKDMDIPSGDAATTLLLERVTSNEAINAMDKLTKKLDKKYEKDHLMPVEKADNSHIQELDRIFVTAFNIQHVSPLEHRLRDPLHQHNDFHKFIPQRFHLMTKESYKCPIPECEQYVCKPHLRGAQANFEKRTAVLDYLPRVVVEVVSGDLLASATSTVLVKFQNRHMEKAKMTIDCSVNDKDPFSTAKVECSNRTFDMDPINIHIKVAQGGTKTEQTFDNGDYSNGKEVGIHFKVTPKYYTQADIKFSINIMFETMLEIKKDKAPPKKSDFKDIKLGLSGKAATTKEIVPCELPFILDFDLGSAKKLHPSSSGRKISDAQPSQPIGNTIASPSANSTDAKVDTDSFKTDSTSPPANTTSVTTSATTTDESKGHKSRGSNELAKSNATAVTESTETTSDVTNPPADAADDSAPPPGDA